MIIDPNLVMGYTTGDLPVGYQTVYLPLMKK
jgi:hypothetical protein